MIVIYQENLLDNEKFYPLLGRNIKKIRQQHNMTQEQLAELIDVDQKQVSHIESGRARAKLPVYLKIANVFDISLDVLLADMCLPGSTSEHSTLSGEHEQRLFGDVVHAVLHYLRKKET